MDRSIPSKHSVFFSFFSEDHFTFHKIGKEKAANTSPNIWSWEHLTFQNLISFIFLLCKKMELRRKWLGDGIAIHWLEKK